LDNTGEARHFILKGEHILKISKKVLASLLVSASITGSLSANAATVTDSVTPFKDLEQAATWSRDSITQAQLLGLFNGDNLGNFRPNDLITREEMAKLLTQLLNLPLETSAKSEFSDVPSGTWGLPYIEAVRNAGIMQGYGNGKFDPKAVMTREQLAIVFVKALNLPLEPDLGILDQFEDAASIHDWSSQYVAAALKAGLMAGNGKTFGATTKANRQEAAMVVVRVHSKKTEAENQAGSGNETPSTPSQPSVPGTVIPPGTISSVPTTPVTSSPAVQTPSTGGGSTTPTPPVTPPIESSLPAVATSLSLSDLNFKDIQSTEAAVTSQILTNLDFSTEDQPASAVSKVIESLDFSTEKRNMRWESFQLQDFDFEANPVMFSISNDTEHYYPFTLDKSFDSSEELVAYLNAQIQQTTLKVDAVFDPSTQKLLIVHQLYSPSAQIYMNEISPHRFWDKSIEAQTLEHTKTFIISNGSYGTIVVLNQKFTDLSALASFINEQLAFTPTDAAATANPDGTLTIYRESMSEEGNLQFLESENNAFFTNNIYHPTPGVDRSSQLDIELNGQKVTIDLNRNYVDLDDLAQSINNAFSSNQLLMTVAVNPDNTLKLLSYDTGSSQKIVISETSDSRVFTPGEYSGTDTLRRSKTILIKDHTHTARFKMNRDYTDIQDFVDTLNSQLVLYGVQAVASVQTPQTFKITSKAIGKSASLKIEGDDTPLFFAQDTFSGSGPDVDQAPGIGGVPTVSQANQFFSQESITPFSSDSDIESIELARSTETGVDYTVSDYDYLVEGYTLGTEITEEGSYRLKLKDTAGHETVTYFSIETTWPVITSITQEQSSISPTASPYEYDQGDQLTFKLNNFVLKYDSLDEQNAPLDYVDVLMIASLEAALTRNPANSAYTFGQGATLTTDEVMPGHPSYGRTFTLTLGSGANLPSEGFNLILFTSDLITPSGLRASFSSSAMIPALRLPY